ncbi:MAG: hypothetical protein JW833_13550 [Prolixibacteraceae bacterium]|nr:hypothetical protein [Prolixibacteraceae bacterium]
MIKKYVYLYFVLFYCFVFNISAQENNVNSSYAQIFASGWQKAITFISENRRWMEDECLTYGIDYKTAVSVIFPELVRYSILRDKIEITLLKALYTNKGDEYANFSVGVFQIKPTCAETVIDNVDKLKNPAFKTWFRKQHADLRDYGLRKAIVDELEDPGNEFIYVLAIIRFLDKTYKDHRWTDGIEKIRFYAAAYNGGFSNTEAWIRQQMEAKTFHTGIVKPKECYCYADIAADFFAGFSGSQGNIQKGNPANFKSFNIINSYK